MVSLIRAAQGALLLSAMIAVHAVSLAEQPANPWKNRPDVPQPEEPVLISDLEGEPSPTYYQGYEFDTSADLNVAEQAQYRSGGMGAGRGGRTAASPASLSGSGQRTPQSFTVRLARAPNMMGDFGGRGGSEITIQEPSTVVSFQDFLGSVEYEPSGSDGNGAEVSIVGGYAEFEITGAFVAGDATGIALRSTQTVVDIGSATTFDLLVDAAQGSGISRPTAISRYQAAADAYLANPNSDPNDNLAQQQANYTAQHGHGSFTPISGQNNSITFDPDDIGVAVRNNSPPSTSGPSNPTPFGGVNQNANPNPNVAPGEVYFLTTEYLATFGDQLFTPDPVTLLLPSPAAADIVGRVRIQDNNSPMPRDRVFFDYNYFHNVPLTSAGNSINRFAPGAEKTFLDQNASFEVRVPMALTLDNNFVTDGVTETSSNEFGNVALAVKFLLDATDTTAFAAGIGIALPTADDLNVNMADGTQLVRVENDSTRLLPYVAGLITPENSSWYFQYFLTFDFDTKGNGVLANVNGTGLEEIGVWNDQHLVTLSLATGSWFYENYSPASMVKRIGWQAEVHYTDTLNNADSVAAGNFRVGDPNAELSLVNGTIGLNFHVGKTIFTTGYSVPVSDDRVFDGELRAFVNRYF